MERTGFRPSRFRSAPAPSMSDRTTEKKAASVLSRESGASQPEAAAAATAEPSCPFRLSVWALPKRARTTPAIPSNRPARLRRPKKEERMTTKVEKTVIVGVPISMAYNQWTQFEEFPAFMGGVQQVRQLDDQRLHWVAEIAGVKREWEARILDQWPDEKVAWAATEGATNAGAVYFSDAGEGRTLVRLELEYEPEGLVEKAGDALNFVDRQARADLDKFKEFIESRDLETGAWRGDVPGAVGSGGGVGDLAG